MPITAPTSAAAPRGHPSHGLALYARTTVQQTADRTTRLTARYANRLPSRSTLLVALRICIGIVYIWFGSLKIAGLSSVNTLVQATLPWSVPGWLVPSLGILEVLIGIAFFWGRRLLLVILPLFVLHMGTTFGVLVMAPQMAFVHHDPVVLTFTGEFVVKNIVLLTAGLAVALAPNPPAPTKASAPAPLSIEEPETAVTE